jgi:TolB-like protein
MQADEQATVAILETYRAVFREQVLAHDGRVVDMTGDSVLAVFDAATAAVHAAIRIQEQLQERNALLPEDRRMRFRIGVNLGELIEKPDGTVYGDGVNIAARMERLGEPDGLCLSGAVYDQVEGKVPLSFRFAGEHIVKNIPKPLRVYHALNSQVTSRKPIRMRFGTGLLLAVAAAAGALIWYIGTHVPTSTDVQADPVLAMPTGPGIAVLPFTNMDGNAGNDYFSDGLTEDIITELARVRDLHVLARNTTFQYKGKAIDVPKLARTLQVQYVLEGSVRRSGSRVRITAQLIDGASGAHLWAERYDKEFEDIFTVQDEITNHIVSAIAAGSAGVVQVTARNVSARKPTQSLEAYELVLRATAPLPYTQEWYDGTLALLERAIQLDPNYARAREEYAWHKLMGWIFRFERTPLPPEQIKQNAIRAVELDPNDASAHRTAAYGYFFSHQIDLFDREAQLALQLAPYDADIYTQLGMAYAFSGQWDLGVNLVKKAYKLNPVSAGGWYHSALHYDYYRKGQYREALEAVRGHPGQMMCETQFKYVAAYGQLGEPEKAKEHWDKCASAVPDMSADWVAGILRIWNFEENFTRRYMDGINKAGYPCRANGCR